MTNRKSAWYNQKPTRFFIHFFMTE